MATIPLKRAVGSTGLRVPYTPVQALLGGQLVEHRDLGTRAGKRACGIAAANSTVVVGVAEYDIRAVASHIGDAFVVDAEHGLTVLSGGVVPITFAAASVRGDLLIPAANGQVTPLAIGTATVAQLASVVGKTDSNAVAVGAVGDAFIKAGGNG